MTKQADRKEYNLDDQLKIAEIEKLKAETKQIQQQMKLAPYVAGGAIIGATFAAVKLISKL